MALGTGSLAVNVTVTDGDGDHASASADVSGQVTFDDDGPSLSISQPNGALNGLFLGGFDPNGDIWGAGSGTNTTGTAAGWTIEASEHDGASSVELQKVGDGYRGADSPTNSVMVDLEASPGNIQISQTIHGLSAGEYRISFEIGAASDPDPNLVHSARLEVIWNGVSVGTYDPTSGLMQTIALDVTAIDGNNTLMFREIGASGDNTGTFLANVKVGDIIVIDETAGADTDSDDTTNPTVQALFNGIVNVGTDPDMLEHQYAQGSGGVVNASALFGADGPAAGGGVSYALTLANNTGVDSGLKTTDGHEISLFNEGGLIVGRVDNADGTANAAGAAALALHIDAGTGQVAVAQFVSLQHPDTTSNDEGISLAAGSVSVTVTATDGDGDHVSQSADISQTVVFEDDGPS